MATGRVPTTANSPLTTKGDLFGYSTQPARLAVGTNEQRLVADSVQTTGLKFVDDTTNYAVGAKGDLLVGTAADTVAALAVGTNGDTIVADSSTATGLSYQANFAAGKNKIINGDFGVNQRAFTTTTSNGAYIFDRFRTTAVDGTSTYSTESFTAGTAPVSGYEATNYLRIVTTGQTLTNAQTRIDQRLEDVRTFAGQQVTVSFWAKANTGTPNVAVGFLQNFGTSGSAAVTAVSGNVTINTSWQRYTFTQTVNSITGKTIGASSFFSICLIMSSGSTATFNPAVGIQSNTFDIWGVQLEAGSTATAFQTATGTIQGELAACQRYYYRSSSSAINPYAAFTQYAPANSTTQAFIGMRLPVSMRVPPTVLEFANLQLADGSNLYTVTSASLDNNTTSNDIAAAGYNVASGLTQYRPYVARGNNSAAAYIGFSAEL